MLPARGHERLVSPLQDALSSDVDPRTCGHLTVHDKACCFEFVEVRLGRPVRDKVGVGNEHARGVGPGAEYRDRLAGLDQQGFVVLECFERADNGMEAIPVAGGSAGAAVHDKLFGLLGDLGVEVVHQHPKRGLLVPALAVEGGPAGGSDRRVF